MYGTSHPRYAFSLAQIGDALTHQGKYTEAAEYSRRRWRSAPADAAPLLREVEKWLADPDAPDEP